MSAPRGRLEEEVVDTLGVRGVATGREGVTASTPAEGVGTRPGDARASASRAGPPCAPSTSAARELSIAVESATLEDEDELKSSRTSSRDASPRPDASGSLRRSPSSPAAAMPAQPGVALQETPVFAAQAVLIKRERSGDASRSKRANSLLSRSVGRDGKELPTMTRSYSWNSRLGHFGSDDDGSPGSESPRLAPPRRARHFGSDDDGSPGSESPRLAPPRR
jgi:hypothetical protein